MDLAAVQCPRCGTFLSWTTFNQFDFTPCSGCSSPVEVEVFPALFRREAPIEDAPVALIEGESTCFYHSDRKALLPCQACGRFICALCDCELKGDHYCPTCLETGKKKGKIRNLNNSRTKYDSIALSLALLPVIFVYTTLITAPLTLYVAIRYWNSPLSVAHQTRIRFILAVVFAIVQIALWFLLIVVVVGYLYG